jgi:hypothetical protein
MNTFEVMQAVLPTVCYMITEHTTALVRYQRKKTVTIHPPKIKLAHISGHTFVSATVFNTAFM